MSLVVPRRDLLRAAPAGALGLSSLVLPTAFAHASGAVVSAAGTAIDFSGTSRLAHWSLSATNGISYPAAASGVLTGSGLSGQYTRGGTTISTTSDGRHVWSVQNASATLDRTTAPYLEWALTTTTKAVRLQAFALHSIAWFASTITFSCDIDAYATILRQVTGGNGGSYSNLLVNLSGLPTIAAGTTVRLRAHFHNAANDSVFLPSSSSQTGVTSPLDDYNAVQGFANMSLVGSTLT